MGAVVFQWCNCYYSPEQMLVHAPVHSHRVTNKQSYDSTKGGATWTKNGKQQESGRTRESNREMNSIAIHYVHV